MSNYLAIATVTGALYEILSGPVTTAVPGAVVRFRRPDRTSGQEGTPHVNVYLYQVTPNAAFRNVDLPTRRSDGTLVKQPVAALDLHYLFTFHGSDDQLEPQLMLGAVAVTLQTQPVITPQNIQSATSAATGFSFHPLYANCAYAGRVLEVMVGVFSGGVQLVSCLSGLGGLDDR
jgi:hypothetical protein